MRQFLLSLFFPFNAFACAFHLSPPVYTEIRLDQGEKILVLKERALDPDLMAWLEYTVVDEAFTTLQLAKHLTKEISREFDSPGKYQGSPLNLIGMAMHTMRNRAYENTFDVSGRSYFAGDIIRAKMANNRQRSALLLAALESQGLEPKFKYGLANIRTGRKKVVDNSTHAWLTLKINNDEYLLDPTLRVVMPVEEVNVLGSRDASLNIPGVRYYRGNLSFKGEPSEVRYEEMGEYELRRLSVAEIKARPH